MNRHPAYPTCAQLACEDRAEAAIARHVEATQRLAAILRTAADAVAGLDFEFGFPLPGYDPEDVLSMLRQPVTDYVNDAKAMVALSAWAHEREMEGV